MADQLGIGQETVRRWVVQADIDGGNRAGVNSEEPAEIRRLKAENRRLRADNEILRQASIVFAGKLDPATADHGLPRGPRSQGHAVESTGRVLTAHGCPIAAGTYRS